MEKEDRHAEVNRLQKGEEEFVCRCEEVSRRMIVEAIEDGARSLDAVKRQTRAGMGLCQGRTCRHLVSKLLSEMRGEPQETLVPPTVRPPVRPLPVESLLKGEDQI